MPTLLPALRRALLELPQREKDQLLARLVAQDAVLTEQLAYRLLEGGGHLNGSLLKAGLVDELSLLHYPVIDGAASSPTIFEQGQQPQT